MSSTRALIYVQHLLGIGHLKRAELLACALNEAGVAVELVSGGVSPPGEHPEGVRFTQLPALKSADAAFTSLVDAAGRPIDASWQAQRRARLLEAFQRWRPHALIVETFPFGRRALRFELVPLLEGAHDARPRPCVVSSTRDILQVKRDPRRTAEIVGHVQRWFDHVLVHGDPRFARFEETFPDCEAFAERLHYTGLIARPAGAYRPRSDGVGRGEVLVSAGGGAVGRALFSAAMGARPLGRARDVPWRLLAGPNVSDDEFAALRRQAPAGVTVERARPDFPRLLAACAVSISQAGYNTVTDILRAGARAVLVPFRAQGETEQSLRAARLAERGAAQVVPEASLDAAALARAVDAALDAPPASVADVDLDGAERSARLLTRWLAAGGGAAA